VANGGEEGCSGKDITSFSPTPSWEGNDSVSSYSIGIMARAARTSFVSSCVVAMATTSSGSAFHVHTRTRPSARFIIAGANWLMAQAPMRVPRAGVPPPACTALPISIRSAALR
jgi:hypothetical protein